MIIYRPKQNRLYGPADTERRKPSAGRSASDARDPFEKDYGRIIHSAAFRRLQSKTQVIGGYAGDIHRTRLTHSMEVAQIARGIAIHLNTNHPFFHEHALLDGSLVEAAALAHDLGHPPFGHRGEVALNQCMRAFGGFEGNAHTFRILTRLEGEKGEYGLNLTRGLLLSILKYPILLDEAVNEKQYDREKKAIPPKASVFSCDQEAFAWVLASFTDEEKAYLTKVAPDPERHTQTLHKTLECSIIELADDIAYGTHDVEDALNLRLIRLNHLKELLYPFKKRLEYPELMEAWCELDGLDPEHDQLKYRLKKVIAAVISTFITQIRAEKTYDTFSSPRLLYRVELPKELRDLLDSLKRWVSDEVIESQRVQTIAWRGAYVIEKLFSAFMNDDRLLTEHDRHMWKQVETEVERARIVCDYIAGMTDSFAMKMFARLYGQSRNFFDY
ncbi:MULTISPECIES: anti-phage deoxyguanosine triphosphatase [Thermoactinomyces]|jgi:dGTPase|uniref:Deoxyguanosinetriphosphate triphosphohydrolase-like protein n=1 Tax=Thermoactinomyces daqus TaxID=1329516 RepID=A0A7W1X775_9BACL|nr:MULTISPECIES: anti-phage deoxyguanosine triphosphatase [Thermoactinomyces]MBA4541330.1 dGTPase [Thermoactinomyces daqus]MBH8596803.1 dGTPase [Thermoactinomyces sp. CICC 10523]MBH8603564.1 dGTPase [Thermoactinomyces sp. CICC 10522]